MPELHSLPEWLDHLGRIHPKMIEMGLERTQKVRRALQLNPEFRILIVTGTNGKGSVCAMLESILLHAGFRVGCYTSPHLLRFNERIRIDRLEASDADICAAFEKVERSRGDISLTYFEFSTLAAVKLFVDAQVDVAILEVGLGGRLDAVNVFDADCALITSIDLDHMDYLGNTREDIGREKAGIMRANRPVVCGEADVPHSVVAHAAEIGAKLHLIGRDFSGIAEKDGWRYAGALNGLLPLPALYGNVQLQNAAVAIAALEQLQLGITAEVIAAGITDLNLPGRFQLLQNNPEIIVDVAHNPHAAKVLAENLRAARAQGRTIAVFSMLGDKDIGGVVRELREEMDCWFVAELLEARAAGLDELLSALSAGKAAQVATAASVAAAFVQACEAARENDRIIVFGSFHTVSQVMELM